MRPVQLSRHNIAFPSPEGALREQWAAGAAAISALPGS